MITIQRVRSGIKSDVEEIHHFCQEKMWPSITNFVHAFPQIFIHRIWPLLALFGTVYAVKTVFGYHSFSDQENAAVLLSIGVTYIIAIMFIIYYSERWSLRALGQVATYTSDSLLYIAIGFSALGKRGRASESLNDFLRSGFVVGGILLVTGLFYYGFKNKSNGKVEKV